MTKRNLRMFIIAISGIVLFIQACSKYNTPEPLQFKELQPKIGSPEYYEALRAYKNNDHSIAFGWWGASAPPAVTSDMSSRYMSLPDSIDIISLWGGIPRDSAVFQEMQHVRRVKGTRFVMVLFDDSVFLDRWSDTTFESTYDRGDDMLVKGFELIARRLKDTIDRYQLDGLDLDHEPNVCGCDWGLLKDTRKYSMFLTVLSKYVGPLSGTRKLFIVDGEFEMISADAAKGLSYIVTQAYATSSPADLQDRFNRAPARFPPGKFIVTENMQQFGASGVRYIYNDVNIGSVLGMATWNPTQGRKGGFGAYIIERDVLSNPSQGYYYYLRRGIQIQNPAPY